MSPAGPGTPLRPQGPGTPFQPFGPRRPLGPGRPLSPVKVQQHLECIQAHGNTVNTDGSSLAL